MENAIITGVLLAVVGVGLFGLYYASSSKDPRTMYVPVITGMSAFTQGEANITFNSLIGISLSGGNCSGVYGPVLNVTPQQTANLAYIDTFGASTYCAYYDVIEAPCDSAYGGTSNNGTLLAIIEDNSNAYIQINARRNNSLPTGFFEDKLTIIPFNTNTTPTGTNDAVCCRDHLANTTFDSANSVQWEAATFNILGNWSDGTGKAGDPPVKYDIATSCEFYPYQVAAGTYTIKYDFEAQQTS